VDLWDASKLSLFALFVVPGFIAIKCYQLFFPGTHRSASEQLVDAIAYSVINYALWFIPAPFVQKELSVGNGGMFHFFYHVAVVFVSPIILVWIWKCIRTSQLVQRSAPHPVEKPWDFVFRKREAYWLKIFLKNGEVLAGRYGSNSFASSAPSDEQLYLEEVWILGEKGQFERVKDRSAGAIISSSEISYVEFKR